MQTSSVLRVVIQILIIVSLLDFCNSQIVQCQKLSLKGEGFVAVVPPQQVLSVSLEIESFFGLSLQQPIAGRADRVSGFANEVATAPTVGYEHRWGLYEKKFNFTYKGIQPPIINEFNGTRYLRAPLVQLLNYLATDNVVRVCVEFCSANPEPIEITWYKQIGIYNHTDDVKKLKRDRRWLKQSFDFVCEVSKKVLPVIAELTAPECPGCPTVECPLCEQVPCECGGNVFPTSNWFLIGGAVLDLSFFVLNLVFFYCSGKKNTRTIKRGLVRYNELSKQSNLAMRSESVLQGAEMDLYEDKSVPLPPPMLLESFSQKKTDSGPVRDVQENTRLNKGPVRPKWQDDD